MSISIKVIIITSLVGSWSIAHAANDRTELEIVGRFGKLKLDDDNKKRTTIEDRYNDSKEKALDSVAASNRYRKRNDSDRRDRFEGVPGVPIGFILPNFHPLCLTHPPSRCLNCKQEFGPTKQDRCGCTYPALEKMLMCDGCRRNVPWGESSEHQKVCRGYKPPQPPSMPSVVPVM
ncbi:MAG: hypothetical protein RLZ12_604 [Bacillota bacterium]|jgi:hypothetical protein